MAVRYRASIAMNNAPLPGVRRRAGGIENMGLHLLNSQPHELSICKDSGQLHEMEFGMKHSAFGAVVFTLAAASLGLASPAAASTHHRRADPGHGHCLRFNKATGTAAGAVAGGVLGKVLLGGTGGVLAGAAAGGLAGHELAHNGRKRCR